MTLATAPRYDPDEIEERRGHAVVVGANMSGLIASRVLIDRFQTVTLIDKDPLVDDASARPGTPQANHIHVMKRAGQVVLEDLFPGNGDDLTDAGALTVDLARGVKIYTQGDFFAHGPSPIQKYSASRPLFEQTTRRRVAKLDRVTI